MYNNHTPAHTTSHPHISISNDLLWPRFLSSLFLEDEKPKLKRKLVQLDTASPRLETDCLPPQLKCARNGPSRVGQRNPLWSGEPSSSSAPRRRPVVVLKRLREHDLHSALCPQPPTAQGIAGCSDDVHNNDDCENSVGDVNQDHYPGSHHRHYLHYGDAVTDKDCWGLATGGNSLAEDSWKGIATACTRDTETLSRINAKDNKAKIKSKSVTVWRQNGG